MNHRLKNLYSKYTSPKAVLSMEDKQRIKEKVFARLSEPLPEPTSSFWSGLKKFTLHSYVLVPLVLLLFIVSTTVASAHALPGDVLYPVKRQVESARVYLAQSPEDKLDLEVNFAQKRLQELEDVKATVPEDSTTAKPEDNSTLTKKTRKQIKRETAERNAHDALDFLEKTSARFQEKGDSRSENLNKAINNFKTIIKTEDSSKGRTQGAFDTIIKSIPVQNNSDQTPEDNHSGSTDDHSGRNRGR